VQGNLHAPFGKRTTEKDLHHRHLAGARLHSAGGDGETDSRNAARRPVPDPTGPGVGSDREIFFSITTRQAIRRGSFGSVKELVAAIGRFIDGWNERCHPFVWTKTADELLDHCRPGQRTSFTRH
jgi:hypothetical protein